VGSRARATRDTFIGTFAGITLGGIAVYAAARTWETWQNKREEHVAWNIQVPGDVAGCVALSQDERELLDNIEYSNTDVTDKLEDIGDEFDMNGYREEWGDGESSSSG
jgi:hypothetical protein